MVPPPPAYEWVAKQHQGRMPGPPPQLPDGRMQGSNGGWQGMDGSQGPQHMPMQGDANIQSLNNFQNMQGVGNMPRDAVPGMQNPMSGPPNMPRGQGVPDMPNLMQSMPNLMQNSQAMAKLMDLMNGTQNMQRGPNMADMPNLTSGPPPNMPSGPPNMPRGPQSMQNGPQNMPHIAAMAGRQAAPDMRNLMIGSQSLQRWQPPPDIQNPQNVHGGPQNMQSPQNMQRLQPPPDMPRMHGGPQNMHRGQGAPDMQGSPQNMMNGPQNMMSGPQNMMNGQQSIRGGPGVQEMPNPINSQNTAMHNGPGAPIMPSMMNGSQNMQSGQGAPNAQPQIVMVALPVGAPPPEGAIAVAGPPPQAVQNLSPPNMSQSPSPPNVTVIAVPVGEAPPEGAIPLPMDLFPAMSAPIKQDPWQSSYTDHDNWRPGLWTPPKEYEPSKAVRPYKGLKITDPRTGKEVVSPEEAAAASRRMRILNPQTGEEVKS